MILVSNNKAMKNYLKFNNNNNNNNNNNKFCQKIMKTILITIHNWITVITLIKKIKINGKVL